VVRRGEVEAQPALELAVARLRPLARQPQPRLDPGREALLRDGELRPREQRERDEALRVLVERDLPPHEHVDGGLEAAGRAADQADPARELLLRVAGGEAVAQVLPGGVGAVAHEPDQDEPPRHVEAGGRAALGLEQRLDLVEAREREERVGAQQAGVDVVLRVLEREVEQLLGA
jgi:hypothetical protein